MLTHMIPCTFCATYNTDISTMIHNKQTSKALIKTHKLSVSSYSHTISLFPRSWIASHFACTNTNLTPFGFVGVTLTTSWGHRIDILFTPWVQGGGGGGQKSWKKITYVLYGCPQIH